MMANIEPIINIKLLLFNGIKIKKKEMKLIQEEYELFRNKL